MSATGLITQIKASSSVNPERFRPPPIRGNDIQKVMEECIRDGDTRFWLSSRISKNLPKVPCGDQIIVCYLVDKSTEGRVYHPYPTFGTGVTPLRSIVPTGFMARFLISIIHSISSPGSPPPELPSEIVIRAPFRIPISYDWENVEAVPGQIQAKLILLSTPDLIIFHYMVAAAAITKDPAGYDRVSIPAEIREISWPLNNALHGFRKFIDPSFGLSAPDPSKRKVESTVHDYQRSIEKRPQGLHSQQGTKQSPSTPQGIRSPSGQSARSSQNSGRSSNQVNPFWWSPS